MPIAHEDRRSVSIVGAALLRLDRAVERLEDRERRTHELLRTWQERWRGRQRRIAERLRSIDEQLGTTLAESATADSVAAIEFAPRLGVVGVPANGAEMSSTGG